MSTENIFKGATDWLHILIGFIAGIFLLLPFGWLASLFIAVLFAVYQALDSETRIESIEDMVEFIYGFIIAIIVVVRWVSR
jgi:type IV secretory pathway TrbD component